jgi:hypothetical protein
MLRFSVEPGPARANMCAVYALFGVVLIPVSFLAIRLSQEFIHPVVFTRKGPQMTGSQLLTFCVAWAAMLALSATLVAEITSRYRIPIVWLHPSDLLAGRRGITSHLNVTLAFHRSDHTDPGPNFPVDRYMTWIRRVLAVRRARPAAARY